MKSFGLWLVAHLQFEFTDDAGQFWGQYIKLLFIKNTVPGTL
jgi:hypothetical protein